MYNSPEEIHNLVGFAPSVGLVVGVSYGGVGEGGRMSMLDDSAAVLNGPDSRRVIWGGLKGGVVVRYCWGISWLGGLTGCAYLDVPAWVNLLGKRFCHRFKRWTETHQTKNKVSSKNR